jgi:hypothetical protein
VYDLIANYVITTRNCRVYDEKKVWQTRIKEAETNTTQNVDITLIMKLEEMCCFVPETMNFLECKRVVEGLKVNEWRRARDGSIKH